ncbi:hypothetical protein MKX01_026623 [Papaver californicum]|nr:hypothetical protein MKX01_026623 [Papaver californicum]
MESDIIYYAEDEDRSQTNTQDLSIDQENYFNTMQLPTLDTNYIVSDMEVDQVQDFLRPTPSPSSSPLRQELISKRVNPEQLVHLFNSGIESSTNSDYIGTTQEECLQWMQQYKSPKRPRTESTLTYVSTSTKEAIVPVSADVLEGGPTIVSDPQYSSTNEALTGCNHSQKLEQNHTSSATLHPQVQK